MPLHFRWEKVLAEIIVMVGIVAGMIEFFFLLEGEIKRERER